MNLSQRYRNTEEHECQFRVSACARKQFFNRPNEVEGQCWSGGRFCSQPVQMPSFRKPPSLPVGKMQIACLNVSTIAARFPMPTPTRSSAIWMSNQPSVAQIRRPVILFDVMDTIVRDPFHDRMPAYFGFTFKELLAAKHPTAWIEFEKGLLSEEEFAASFFQDGREYDYEGLKLCMASGYEYLDGMATLLQRLQGAGFEMHAFSNYPSWYTMIEDKLKLSQYLPWSFVSCHSGLRKPDHQAYLDAAEHLGVQPSECIFVDDQPRNIEAAAKVGMLAIQFQNAESLEKELVACGVSLQPEVSFSHNVVCDQI